jgi:hypothetical protein
MGVGLGSVLDIWLGTGLGEGVLLKAPTAAPPTAATPETPALPTSQATPTAVLVTLTAAAPTATTAQPLRLMVVIMAKIMAFIVLFPLFLRQLGALSLGRVKPHTRYANSKKSF